jgi:hypothetical protein
MTTPLTAGSPFLIDEIILVDLLALFLAITTVSILWYLVKKIFPDEVKRPPIFLDLHRCDCSVCNRRLLRDGCRKLRCDNCTVWLAAGLAVKRPIVGTDCRWGNFLYLPIAVAMVGLA